MRAAALLLALAGCGRTVPWDPPDDLATAADLGALPVDKLDLAEIAEVDAASPPVEECNGRDDDGDGLVDEKCIKPVSPAQSSIKRAHIDGDRIAVDHFFRFDVIDLVDGGVTRVEEAPPDGGTTLYATDGDLRGGWLAWRAVDQQQIIGYGVRARHLPTGRQFMRSDPRLKDYGPVQVDEGRVVFAGRGDRADTDIWLWDTASDELRNLSFAGPIESAPDIAGSLVVWERREVPNGESQLRALDLDSGRLLAPTDGLSGTHIFPVVDGGRVVWRRDWTDPTTPSRMLKEFWLYDARTEERRRIGETDEAGIAQLDGDRLCWIQGFARSSTWVHDLSTEKSLRISTRQGQCDISGRRVVLVEYDYGSTLFLRELLPDELLIVGCLLALGCNRAGVTLGEPPLDDGGMTIPVDTPKPDLAQRLPQKERCNGEDDDLDGKIDEGCPIRLTIGNGDDTAPSLDGKLVAWTRVGPDKDSSGIFVRELPDGAERRVAADVANVWLNGGRVAFYRAPDYIVVDVNTLVETKITASGNGYSHGVPILDGDHVLWSEYDPVNQDAWQENYEIYLASAMSGGDLVRISPYYAGQRTPFIKGDHIVWSDDRNGHHALGFAHLFEVWAADLSDGATPRMIFPRHSDGTDGWVQAFDGERIVFYEINGYISPSWPASGTVDGTCTLHMIDFKTGEILYSEPTTPYADSDCWYNAFAWAAIGLSGKQMVIERDPGGKSDLELVNFETGEKKRLTDYPRRSTHPRLDGSTLVWQDDRNADWDLYWMDLSDVDKGDLSVEGLTP